MVARWVVRGSLLALTAFPIACSGTGVDQGTPPAAGTPVQAATVEENANPLDWAHVVSLKTPVNANCTVYREGAKGDATRTFSAPSNKEGVIRFFPPPASWGTRLTVECQSPTAGVIPTMAVDLNDRTTYTEEDLSGPPPIIASRPALHGDPMSWTPQQLSAAHFPRRPDPVTEAASYSRWLDRVTRPLDIVDAKGVVNPSQAQNSYVSDIANNNWGGVGLVNGPYVEVEGAFRVPAYSSQGSHNSPTASDWVGLGGVPRYSGGGNALIQDGIKLNGDGSVQFWYEYIFSNQPEVITNFTVNQNDDVYICAYAHDSGGNFNINGGYAGFSILNFTRNTSAYFTYIPAPSGAVFTAKTAEWIVERPCATANRCPSGTTCPACPGISGAVMLPFTNYGASWTNETYAYIPQADGTGYAGYRSLSTDNYVMFHLWDPAFQHKLEDNYFPQGSTNVANNQILNQWWQAQ